MKKKNLFSLLVPYVNHGNPTWLLMRSQIFGLLKENNKNYCRKCEQEIKTVQDFTLGHEKPWRKTRNREGDASLFWDLSNIFPEHSWCNLPDDWTNKNGYRGISKNTYKNTGNTLYCAEMSVNNKVIKLGYSKDPKVAAEMYDMGVMKYRNGCGRLNFPNKREEYEQRINNEAP